MRKTHIVAIIDNVTDELCGYVGRGETGEPTRLVNHRHQAYNFNSLVAANMAGNLITEHEKRTIYTPSGEEVHNYYSVIHDCYN